MNLLQTVFCWMLRHDATSHPIEIEGSVYGDNLRRRITLIHCLNIILDLLSNF